MAENSWTGVSEFQFRYTIPPQAPPDGYLTNTTVHLEYGDPATVGNWLLVFLRRRCRLIRIDLRKVTIRVQLGASFIKVRLFCDHQNTTPVCVEFQLYPNGNFNEFMELFRAAKEHLLEREAYVTNYMRTGWLQLSNMERLSDPWPPVLSQQQTVIIFDEVETGEPFYMMPRHMMLSWSDRRSAPWNPGDVSSAESHLRPLRNIVESTNDLPPLEDNIADPQRNIVEIIDLPPLVDDNFDNMPPHEEFDNIEVVD